LVLGAPGLEKREHCRFKGEPAFTFIRGEKNRNYVPSLSQKFFGDGDEKEVRTPWFEAGSKRDAYGQGIAKIKTPRNPWGRVNVQTN